MGGSRTRRSQRTLRRSNQAPKQCDVAEVCFAIESLYVDKLKPYGRILRKRVAEQAVDVAPENYGPDNLPDVDIDHLRKTCEVCHALTVQKEPGGDWSAQIKGRSSTFVDVYSHQDTYSKEFWNNFANYFEMLEDNASLPGGRYACAQALTARQLAFLSPYSLGEVCHIVQLAISQKKILGHINGSLVPYKSSQSMRKAQLAELFKPCGSAQNGSELKLATWEDAPSLLRTILESAAREDKSPLPLSNVKRRFRSHCQRELSETALGFSKLSDLLMDRHFRDVCSVKLEGHGYSVFLEGSRLLQKASIGSEKVGEVLGDHGFRIDSEPRRVQVPESRLPGYTMPCPIQRTFVHVPLPPPTPLAGAKRRASSMPKDMGSDRNVEDPICDISSFMTEPEPVQRVALVERSSYGMCASSPKEPDLAVGGSLKARRPGFCDEILTICTDSVPAIPQWSPCQSVSENTISLPAIPQWSPSQYVSENIRNTFIHRASPPPTPASGVICRSKSLPKEIGSQRSPIETACHTLSYKQQQVEDQVDETSEWEPRFVPLNQTPIMTPVYWRVANPIGPLSGGPLQLSLADHIPFQYTN